jgi:hypothetical protein
MIDLGGSVMAYYDRAQTFDGQLPDICASACTEYLRHGCVTPSTVLYFHRATTPLGTALMRKMYPDKVRAWVDRHGALDGDELTIMTGAEAIRLGVRKCRSR